MKEGEERRREEKRREEWILISVKRDWKERVGCDQMI